ncbi:MAG TPA: zf-HC2 domain-containing protein, partial [Acidobacteriota bacterium]|nr:zf-HC2 domain-containing protein [Acidobacteriota bacterium]
MKCEKCEKLLVGYLYQELSAKRMIEVEKHLQSCRICARTLESWQTIHAGYQKTTVDEEASPFLKQRILMAAKEQLTKEPSWIQSALAVLKPVIVLPIIVVSLLAVLYMQFTPARKMAVHKFDVQKAPPVSEMSEPRLRDNRELATEEKKELKSLGYVGDDESDRQKDLAARRQSVPKSSEVVGGESEPSVAFDSLEQESRRDQPQAEVAPPAAPEAASAPAEAPASPANEGYVSRGETKQEQLGLGHKAAKVAGLTGQSNFQEAQMKFREDNLKEGWTYA